MEGTSQKLGYLHLVKMGTMICLYWLAEDLSNEIRNTTHRVASIEQLFSLNILQFYFPQGM